MMTKLDRSSCPTSCSATHLRPDLSRTRSFQMLALKCLSVYQLTVRTLNDLNSAVLTALQEEGLYDGGLSAKTYRLDVATVGVSVGESSNRTFSIPLSGNAIIAPFKGAAKCRRRQKRGGSEATPFFSVNRSLNAAPGFTRRVSKLVKCPAKQGRAPSHFACDHGRDFAPISREQITACLFGAPASDSVRLRAEVGN